MHLNAIIPDGTVVIDGEGRHIDGLVPPDEYARAYSWDGEVGFIDFGVTKEREMFLDAARVEALVNAWTAHPPPPPQETTDG